MERRPAASALRQALGALLVLATFACRGSAPGPQRVPFPDQDSAAYVGMDACAECHLGVYSTYRDTGMGRAFGPLRPDTALADWSERNTFVDERSGLHYEMTQRDGRFYQRQFMLSPEGDPIAEDERELSFFVGSNNHNRAYVTSIDGKWFQAPVCWYPQASRWDLCPGYEHKNDHFAREVTPSCIFCHNGAMTLEAGERNRYEEPIPHGIGCERCHGPGSLHVERWRRSADEARGDPDPTIVNPRRLTVERRIEICSQCHLGDSRATERIQRTDVDLYAYRPGRPLSDVIVPHRFVHATEHDFGLSAQSDRLMLSRCFTESDGRLECLTCHNPHVSVYHADRPSDLFRRRCLGCHAVDACGAAHEDREATAGVADDCVACHMRRAEPDDQRFTSFIDHWIRRRLPAGERDTRSGYDVAPVAESFVTGMDDGERSFYLARAQYLMGEDGPPSARETLWRRSIESFREAIDSGHDDAETRYYLGKALMHRGELEAAVVELRRALEHDANHRNARFALGQALGSAGDLPGAEREFARLLEGAGDDPMALAEWARAAWTMGRAEPALVAYDRARELEPWNALLNANIAATLASLGRFDEARGPSLEALRLNPDSAEAWTFHAHLTRELGLDAESRIAADVAARLGAPMSGD